MEPSTEGPRRCHRIYYIECWGAALVLLRLSQQTAHMSRSRTRIIQALLGRLLATYSNATNVAQVTTCKSQQTQIVKLKIPDPEPLNPVCQIAHPQTSRTARLWTNFTGTTQRPLVGNAVHLQEVKTNLNPKLQTTAVIDMTERTAGPLPNRRRPKLPEESFLAFRLKELGSKFKPKGSM